MPQITAIKLQKRKKDRFNIFLDGVFAFSLTAQALAKAGLHENQEISSKKVTTLVRESELQTVFEKVLKFLSYRPRSEFEIEEYLLKKGVGEKTRKMVLGKLKGLDLLDDLAFARWWVEQRSTFSPRGIKAVRFELRRKGIDKELIERVLAELRSSSTDLLLAERLVKKKLSRLKNLPQLEQKKKLYFALAQKGFSYEIIKKAVAKFVEKE